MRKRQWRVACAAIFLTTTVGAWLTACQDGTGPSYVRNIQLIPDSAYVPVGESYDFRLVVFDQRGDSMPDRVSRVDLRNRNPELVTAELDGARLHVTTLQTGSAVLEMNLGFGSGLAKVLVTPEHVDHIEIDPTPIIMENGGQFHVQARLFDEAGNELSPEGHHISWKSLDSGNGIFVTDLGFLCTVTASFYERLPHYDELTLIVDNLSVSTQITVQ